MVKKADTLKDVFKNIKNAYDFHDVENWKKKVQRYVGYLNGDWGTSGEENKYVVNTIYNLANLIIPSLFYQAPWIRVAPTKRWVVKKLDKGEYRFVEASRSATLFEHVINNTIKRIDCETEWRKALQDALTHGFGIVKIGYDPGDTELERDIENAPKEEVYLKRCSPFDIGWDPMASNPPEARYVIHRNVRSLSDVKDDPNLRNTADLKGMALSEETSKYKKKEDAKDSGDWVELYEYHDQVNDYIYTVAKQMDKTTKGKEKVSYRCLWERKNPDKIKCHFEMIKFTGDNDKWIAPPMLGMIEDEALAINETTTLMVNHVRQFPGVIMHEHGTIDEDEIDAFENGEQGSILQVQAGALREGKVQRTPPLPMGGEYFNTISMLGGLVDKVLGVPDFQSKTDTKRKTATEVSYEGQDSAIRRAYFLGFVKKFIVNSTQKMATLIQQYYTEDREIRITGEFDEFWKWNHSDIAGEFDFDFDVEAMRVYSASRAQGIINALNALAQYPILQPMMAQIDPEACAAELFKNLDVNFEAIKKKKSISHIEYNPHQENELAMQGRHIPDPKPGEPHEDHINIHMQTLQELMAVPGSLGAQELQRHVSMHQFIAQVAGRMPGQQMVGQQMPAMGTPGAMGGPAPAGGAQQGPMAEQQMTMNGVPNATV